MDDQQKTQIERTYAIARERLADMEAQRDELTETINDLRDQLEWGERLIASMASSKNAAE
jgi:cell division protein FtsB